MQDQEAGGNARPPGQNAGTLDTATDGGGSIREPRAGDGARPPATPHPHGWGQASRRRRVSVMALVVVGMALLFPGRAAAQSNPGACDNPSESCPGDTRPPTITITPATAWVTSSALAVTIGMADDNALSQPSFEVLLNGADVTAGFAYSGSPGSATATGTLTLTPGSNPVQVSVCDTAGNCQIASANYTYSPNDPPPASSAVEVSPDGGDVHVREGQSGTMRFSVRNRGPQPATFLLTHLCQGEGVRECSLSRATLTLAAGDSGAVGVVYRAGPVSSGGWIWLTAQQSDAPGVHDQGMRTVSVWAADAPGLVGDVGEGTSRERSLCLTLPAAAEAVYECGDLRLAHGLPGLRTRNKGRAAVLLYNSEHAAPRPVVGASVKLPATGPAPGTLRLTLQLDNGMPPTSRTVPGWEAGQTRRVAMSLDADLPTGVHGYTFRVQSVDDGSTVLEAPGRLVVVNRAQSPFGTGWWLAGLERLVDVGEGQKLWVGGDGSTRLYRPVPWNAGRWVADAVDRPDTLRQVGGEYVRTLPGRTRVVFGLDGLHRRTESPRVEPTHFAYQLGSDHLEEIRMPGGALYRFGYDAQGRLRTAQLLSGPGTDAVTRTVRLEPAGADMRLGRIIDPDSSEVHFGYADGSGRIGYRRDRMGVWSTFVYDAGARLMAAWTTDTVTAQTVQHGYTAQESKGLALPLDLNALHTVYSGPRDDVPDNTAFWLDRWGAPVRIRNALGHDTWIERGDDLHPALVTRVRHPNGRELTATYTERGNLESSADWSTLATHGRVSVSTYSYGDPSWPDFATQATAPEGEVTRMGYDGQTGQRLWQQAGPDSARRVHFAYHAADDAVAPGLPRSVQSAAARGRGEHPERFEYDARGNLRLVRSPSGVLTLSFSDALGRDTLTVTPVDSATARDSAALMSAGTKQRTVYDAAGRVWQTRTTGPRVAYPGTPDLYGNRPMVPVDSQAVVVVNEYDKNGSLRAVTRRSEPDEAGVGPMTQRWSYDGLGRRLTETAADGMVDSTFYDLAGNVVRTRTRRGYEIEMRYDALNRLTRRITPATKHNGQFLDHGTHSAYAFPVERPTWYYPLFSPDANGNLTITNSSGLGNFTLPGDTAVFAYDAMGNVVLADNRDAQIRRGYYANGMLRGDTLRIRTYVGQDFSRHEYALGYAYDLNGRRTGMQQANPGTGAEFMGEIRYGYDPVTGLPTEVRDAAGQYRFLSRYDMEGRLERREYAGVAAEDFDYDADGQLRRRERSRLNGAPPAGLGNPLGEEFFRYDGRGKRMGVEVFRVDNPMLLETVENAFSGLGHLVWSASWSETAGESRLSHRLDALGNTYRTDKVHDNEKVELDVQKQVYYSYQNGSGRLTGTQEIDDVHSSSNTAETRYDKSGNKVWYRSEGPVAYPAVSGGKANLSEGTAFYYGADEKLRVADRRTCVYALVGDRVQCLPMQTALPAFEEYRYDALGRRVLVRTDQRWECQVRCVDGLTRTVWDGDRVLKEIRAPWLRMEQDTAYVGGWAETSQYGQVLYLHGTGLDEPWLIARLNADSVFDSESGGGAHLLVPQANWNGAYDAGTWVPGSNPECVSIYYPAIENELTGEEERRAGQLGGEAVGQSRNGVTNVCVQVRWPGKNLWVTGERQAPNEGLWMGSLVDGMRDATGQMYRRNRYYDPATGRFTQEDPIGLAGGLNLYGFANGDPVGYSDPYGLCPKDKGGDGKTETLADCPRGTAGWTQNAIGGVHEPVVLDLMNVLPVGRVVKFGSWATGALGNLVSRMLSRGASEAGEHIVLGLASHGLERTAASVGGRHLMNDVNWRSTFMSAIGDARTTFTVSLDGLGGSSTYQKVMGAVQRGAAGSGATNWEMAQLYQAGRLGSVNFVQTVGGKVTSVANPFQ